MSPLIILESNRTAILLFLRPGFPTGSALKYAPLWSVWVNGTRKARNLQKNIVLLPFFRYVYYVYAFYLRLSRWISTDIFGSMTFTHLSIYLIHNLKSNLYARLIAFSCKNLSFLTGKHLWPLTFVSPKQRIVCIRYFLEKSAHFMVSL